MEVGAAGAAGLRRKCKISELEGRCRNKIAGRKALYWRVFSEDTGSKGLWNFCCNISLAGGCSSSSRPEPTGLRGERSASPAEVECYRSWLGGAGRRGKVQEEGVGIALHVQSLP